MRSRRRPALAGLAGLGVLLASGMLALDPSPAHAEVSTPSATSSAKTVSASSYDPDVAHAPMPDLAVTVSQTRDLIQQGLTVSWTGGKKSTIPSQQTGGTNYLQIFQCWGDDPADSTRPDRRTCQYGGLNSVGARRTSTRSSEDAVAPEDQPYTTISPGWWEPTQTSIPFTSATGKTLAPIVDRQKVTDPPDLSNNEFYTKYTTNEVSWAGSSTAGEGSISFELQTDQQSPGLGCGRAINQGGSVTGQSCWLVVVPRGTTDADGGDNTSSGLLWQTWKHLLAFKLDFRPVGVQCKLGAAERQLSGSELISTAVGQWQPKLCNARGGAIFSLLTGPESDAALAANGTEPAPLALTSRALPSGTTDNLTYAPIALTGLSIAFAVDELPKADGSVPSDVLARARQRLTNLKLNPRLLAKLLTASYTDAVPSGADKSHLSGSRNLTTDPEFLSINDKEWQYLAIAGVGVSDLQMPLGRSDAADAVWRYIMSDPAAVDFLNGVPDKWGMKVNPNYSTNPRVNPAGVGMTYPTDTFPKADPVTYPGTSVRHFADAVNLVTWRPYANSLDTSGYLVLRGDPQALGPWDDMATPPKFSKGDRGLIGEQAVLGVTDTGAAARYQVLQASLLNAAGAYVAPTTESMKAAGALMTANPDQKQVVQLDPAAAAVTTATAAYPLTVPVYAAANPAMTSAQLRTSYADFITFAVTTGQTPGTGDGQLPEGFAPLPAAWKTQALAAAKKLRTGVAQPTPSPSPKPSSAPAAPAPSNAPAPSPSTPSSTPTPSASPAPGPVTPDDPAVGAYQVLIPAGAAVGVSAAVTVPLLARFRRRLG